MRISVCAVGRLKRAPETELCSDYLARTEKLGRQVGITKAEIVEVPESQDGQAAGRKTQEAGALSSENNSWSHGDLPGRKRPER